MVSVVGHAESVLIVPHLRAWVNFVKILGQATRRGGNHNTAIAPHWGINFHRSATYSFNIYCILFDELLARFGVPMRNLHELEDSALIDMLAEYTQRYTFLFKNVTHLRYDEEFQRCKRTIQFIILELEQRKRTTNNDISILNSDPGS